MENAGPRTSSPRPEAASEHTARTPDAWQDAINQVLSFLPHDPMNAWRRMSELEAEVRAHSAEGGTPSAVDVSRLLELTRIAKDEFLAECEQRERAFYAHERSRAFTR